MTYIKKLALEVVSPYSTRRRVHVLLSLVHYYMSWEIYVQWEYKVSVAELNIKSDFDQSTCTKQVRNATKTAVLKVHVISKNIQF